MNKIKLYIFVILLVFGFLLIGKIVYDWESQKVRLEEATDYSGIVPATGSPALDASEQIEPDENSNVDMGGGNETVSNDIVLESPQPEQKIKSPLIIEGKARGSWFFEASFPVVLTNWDGLIIAEGIAQAQSDWMTEDFVPFKAELEFKADKSVSDRASLILRKDNPSGLPENDDYLEITVFFE